MAKPSDHSLVASGGQHDDRPRQYDAVLIVSFGGPEGPDDVMPFLDNVLRGLPIKPESKVHIAKRYQDFGGVSPINAQVRAFIDALRSELDQHGPQLPIYWGNRNWHPMLTDTLQQMQDDGIKRAIVFVTSMFSSYSGCRKYREDLFDACASLTRPPELDKLRLGFNHPLWIEAVASRVNDAFANIPKGQRASTTLLFTAHSLPQSMAQNSRYELQLASSCALVADACGHDNWRLVYQSNNATYGREPWLGPDISEAITEEHERRVKRVVVAPIGFVCDHMEVIIDLDIEAAETAEKLGVEMHRAGTVGTHPAYIAMVRELITERMSADKSRPALGELGPNHDICGPDCCLSGRPTPPKPSLCSTESELK